MQVVEVATTHLHPPIKWFSIKASNLLNLVKERNYNVFPIGPRRTCNQANVIFSLVEAELVLNIPNNGFVVRILAIDSKNQS